MASHQQERITSAGASMTTKRDAKAAQHHLSTHMLTANQRVESSQPQKLIQKVLHALLSTFRKTQNKEAHSRMKEHPHSEEGTKCSKSVHILFCKMRKRGEQTTLSSTDTHPSISRQRRSVAMWQLNAARQELPISRKSATTSLDQSCPTTSMARHSLLRPYSSSSPEVTLAEHQPSAPNRAFGHPYFHVSPKIRRLTTA